ncbi:glycosyltransferase [Teredinibacter turnerae]|uniref:glycosyltransferase n=1 Tax=Teredinibacter turnerae TaxID=2426 RepID=UPI0003605EAA|nr:glycosyltransferase [Teredinibacter turnerae]
MMRSRKLSEFSVLLSVYNGDNPDYLSSSLESVCELQTAPPTEIILVCDGPLTKALDRIIEYWVKNSAVPIEVIRLKSNQGLAHALNEGLSFVNYELVARMDSDDVSLPDRFEKQISYMDENTSIGVVSCSVNEIDPVSEKVNSVRRLPLDHESIFQMAKSRNPISHPAVVFRKSIVLSHGGYPLFRKSQDYALWSLLLMKGVLFANLPDSLVNMRAGSDLFVRRGTSYLLYEIKIILYQRRIGLINWGGALKNMVIRAVFRCSPRYVQSVLYRLLRVQN